MKDENLLYLYFDYLKNRCFPFRRIQNLKHITELINSYFRLVLPIGATRYSISTGTVPLKVLFKKQQDTPYLYLVLYKVLHRTRYSTGSNCTG